MNKKKELLMNQTYRQFMDAGLGLDNAVSLNDIVDDKLMGFGTTADEKIFNISELNELLARQKEQSKDIDMRWDVKPLSHYTSADEKTAFFADELFLHATIDGEQIEMYLRFSVVLSYVNNKWKVIHWHGSKPENVQSDADTFGIENWKQKAEALEKLVEERTSDLLEKNRELEIESSLERVRAVAMSMHEPNDLLSVAKALFVELKSLGFHEIRNALINTFSDEVSFFLDYDYSEFLGGHITAIPYNTHPLIEKHLKQIKQATDAFAETIVTEKELESWIAGRRANGEPEDRQLQNIAALYYYFYSTGSAAIGLSTYSALSNEKRELLKRFRNVFELAYQRYTDIQKAEAQEREAKIEVALEKVRSRSLAVHKTDEFKEVVTVVFERLQELNIPITSASINIFIEGSKDTNVYMCGTDEDRLVISNFRLIHSDSVIAKDRYMAHKKGLDFFSKTYNRRQKDKYYNHLFEVSDLKYLPADAKQMVMDSEQYTISLAMAKHSMLVVNDFEGRRSLSENEIDILKRFVKVFEQAYTRFLDLQKAEAQAREAQIQLALERVRARTMAMQSSHELAEAASLLFQQVKSLGIETFSSGYTVWENNGRYLVSWMCNADGSMNPPFRMPVAENQWHVQQYQSWKEGEDFVLNDMSGERMKAYFRYLRSFPLLDEAFKISELTGHPMPERQVHNAANFSHGNLLFITYEPVSEAHEIFKRFAKVFEQTYTRFLDLQKAETQAKEAKIEAALEKVRSRSLAMHKSSELQEVVSIVYDRVRDLGVKVDSASVIVLGDKADVMEFWVAVPDQQYSTYFNIPFFDTTAVARDFVKARESGSNFTRSYIGEQKNEQWSYLFEHSDLKNIPEDRKKLLLETEAYTVSVSFTKNTALQFLKYYKEVFSEEENEIFQRFANVFEQAYIRFLDLQKAEAQTKEAQTEAALEKVRSRSLAMHNSNELGDVITVVLEKLQDLGFVIDNGAAAHIHIYTEGTKDFVQWSAAPYQVQPIRSFIPYTDNLLLTDFFEARENGLNFYSKKYSYEEKNSWFKYAFEHSDFKYLPDDLKEALLKSESYTHWIAIGKNSDITVNSITGAVLTDSQIEILKRFGNVFEQAYTRFLDLQKAEAQAREAKIEAALEKVRSHSLAMHTSDELNEVVLVVFEKLKELNVVTDGVALINLYTEGTRDVIQWIANPDLMTTGKFSLPYFNHPVLNIICDAKDSGKDSVTHSFSFEEKNSFWHYSFQHSDYKYLPNELKTMLLESEGYGYAVAFEKYSGLLICTYTKTEFSSYAIDTLKRFGKVFEQAYIRFLDLQKAEAQTRESQVQLALERARTQSMLMQHSIELDDTLRVFHEQVLFLGIPSAFSFLWLPDEENDKHIFWAAWAENNLTVFKSKAINYPLNRNEPATAQCIIDWKSNEPVVSYNVPPAGVEGYFAAWSELIAGVEQLKPQYFSDGLYYVEAFMKYGCFGVMVQSELKEDEKKILVRFAIEFERAYTRFLDLQKAEAQTKEAKIEASLERVRSKAMAMHNSEDLAATIGVFYHELQTYSITPRRCGVGLLHKGTRIAELSTWNTTEDGDSLQVIGELKMEGHPVLDGVYENWLKNEEYHPVLRGNEIKEYYRLIRPHIPFPDYPHDTVQYGYFFYFPEGGVYAWTEKELAEDELQIYRRFTTVLSLTYKRYIDLKKAEAQAREAKIETALEKVRSSSLAMHHSKELEEVVKVVFTNLRSLGIKNIDSANINIFHEGSKEFDLWLAAPGQDYTTNFHLPYYDHPIANDFFQAVEKGDVLHKKFYAFDEKNKYFEYMFQNSDNKYLPEERKKLILVGKAYAVSAAIAKHSSLFIHNYNGIPFSDDDNEILIRFTRVFDQAYSRFLDLQKAEAQTKEAQIEAALEKVRSRSMGMQKSEELKEIIKVVYEQFVYLNILVEHAGFIMDYKARDDMHIWLADKHEVPSEITIPYFDSPHWNSFIKAKDKGEDFFANYLTFEEKNKFYQDLFKLFPVPDEAKDYYFIAPGLAISTVLLENIGLYIENFSAISYTNEENNTLMRFGKVFQQTYTRFNDLKQAEAQAREAKIEAALEKVRSRSLAMYETKELQEVVTVVFEKLQELGITLDAGGAIINIFTEGSKDVVQWIASPDLSSSASYYVPHFDHPIFDDLWNARESGLDFFSKAYPFEVKNSLFKKFFEFSDYKYFPEEFKQWILQNENYSISGAWSKNSAILIPSHTGKLPSEEEKDVIKRFSKVFEQAYIRFMDLQKAEAQSREGQIQLALERVRARTMAMQHSEELSETASVLFEQFNALGETPERIAIEIVNEKEHVFEIWATQHGGSQLNLLLKASLDEPHVMQKMYRAWKEQKKSITIDLQGKELEEYFQFLNSQGLPVKREIFGNRRVQNVATFSKGILTIITPDPRPQETIEILERFAAVFDGTYIRFLDLQKAEAQTRQAKIEAAMEKVRSRAMAMQKPAELVEVAELLRKEMGQLGVEELETSSIYIHHEDSQKTECWYAIKDVQHAEKELVSDHMTIDLNETDIGRKMLRFYRSDKKQLSISMQGDARKEWINYCAGHSKVLVGFYGDSIPDRMYHLYKFSSGYMGAASPGDISPESWDLLQRTTSVFSLAYTRFSDLQQAEAQAKEAKIEAALERVRSRTLAMQKSDELAETAAVMFRQLISLGIEPNRLYINVIKNETAEAEFWITDEDGTKVSSAVHTNMNNNPSFKKMFEGWQQKKKSLILDIRGEELQAYLQHLSSLHVSFKTGTMQQRRMQYLAYFNKGFIGMAAPDEQPEETMLLLERFAAVFNLTFTRFNDLKIAEAHAVQAEEDLVKLQTEKKRAEDALSELQVTQKQLVQSEKMASLGELTAGIAHEIQNPLNFVNNFSEVSNELLYEMIEEVTKGNYEEVKAIADDVIQNLEKINHHGKRADAIVKGMLQHSRSSSATREATDINKLADEYLRLAYHGLRAKDKSFNATLKTGYDDTIGNINIIPQDMGRVILNLITNAFYAVTEKKKEAPAGYEPTVSVSTKKVSDKVEISVADNGNGIPQTVVDKIFQPFFTTKPTGQGTGLGLSLAYDIVKVHGGELKVQTRESKGSEFIICLPITA